jgi:uncharacterized membrane protein YwzB
MKKNSLLSRVSTTAAGAAAMIGSLIATSAVHAQTSLLNMQAGLNTTSTAAGLTTPGASTDLPTLVGKYIAQALGLLGVVLVVLFVYAGFLWMTAEGKEEQVKKAKGILTNAIIGMVIIFAAYAITQFVIGAIISSTQVTS